MSGNPDRVLTPREWTGARGKFVPVGWDEALTRITACLKTLIDWGEDVRLDGAIRMAPR